MSRNFGQYKTIIIKQYFPKIIRFTCSKLYDLKIITDQQLSCVENDYMYFFNSGEFVNKNNFIVYVAIMSIVADIVHSGYSDVYKYQYELYISRLKRWKEKADAVKSRDKYTCSNCGIKYKSFIMPMLDCHHISYDNIYGESPEELLTLCRECHIQ